MMPINQVQHVCVEVEVKWEQFSCLDVCPRWFNNSVLQDMRSFIHQYSLLSPSGFLIPLLRNKYIIKKHCIWYFVCFVWVAQYYTELKNSSLQVERFSLNGSFWFMGLNVSFHRGPSSCEKGPLLFQLCRDEQQSVKEPLCCFSSVTQSGELFIVPAQLTCCLVGCVCTERTDRIKSVLRSTDSC